MRTQGFLWNNRWVAFYLTVNIFTNHYRIETIEQCFELTSINLVIDSILINLYTLTIKVCNITWITTLRLRLTARCDSKIRLLLVALMTIDQSKCELVFKVTGKESNKSLTLRSNNGRKGAEKTQDIYWSSYIMLDLVTLQVIIHIYFFSVWWNT